MRKANVPENTAVPQLEESGQADPQPHGLSIISEVLGGMDLVPRGGGRCFLS